ncbi:MAG: OmpA family protein [Bacteroidetes bacterium]|nr:OmpA family protein [Bacteroidota bacterium]
MMTRAIRSIATVVLFLLCSAISATAQIDISSPPTTKTIPAFEQFIEANAPSEDAFVAVQRLAYWPIKQERWDEAVTIFRKYEDRFPSMRERFEKIIHILQAPSEHLVLTNLGPSVNSAKEEFSPTLSVDGTTLYFTKDNGTSEDEYDEDIMVSEFSNGAWQPAKDVGSGINTKSSESVNSIAADGMTMVLFGNYASSLGRGDLFYSVKQSDGSWGEVHHFPEPINTKDFEGDGCLTSDGTAMLFSSDRPGGVGAFHEKGQPYHGDKWGNTDIYVTLRQPDGTWGTPINLGPTINTSFSERKAFLHPDGKTLYFCSDGHAGLGMFDIFKSTRLNDTSWTEWSEPVNLGKEINNGADNFGYRVSTDGTKAYLSLDNREDGYGGGDIYTMTLSEAAKPAAVATISGTVTDENGKPLVANIRWEDLSRNRTVGELSSDPTSGSFFITLPLEKNYGYYAEKPGYYPVSKNIDLRAATTPMRQTENIVLVSIGSLRDEGKGIRLNNLFFDFNKAELQHESYPELDRLVTFLHTYPDLKVEIGGHTDNKGSAQYNLSLSKKRAQSVVDYLADHGCERDRLIAKGYGDTRPVASNDTDEGRTQNRRVEVRFIK